MRESLEQFDTLLNKIDENEYKEMGFLYDGEQHRPPFIEYLEKNAAIIIESNEGFSKLLVYLKETEVVPLDIFDIFLKKLSPETKCQQQHKLTLLANLIMTKHTTKMRYRNYIYCSESESYRRITPEDNKGFIDQLKEIVKQKHDLESYLLSLRSSLPYSEIQKADNNPNPIQGSSKPESQFDRASTEHGDISYLLRESGLDLSWLELSEYDKNSQNINIWHLIIILKNLAPDNIHAQKKDLMLYLSKLIEGNEHQHCINLITLSNQLSPEQCAAIYEILYSSTVSKVSSPHLLTHS